MKKLLTTVVTLLPFLAVAQLAVTISPVKATGQKAIVPLEMKNGFGKKIESARAVCFLLDDKGKMIGQSTHWVIGRHAGAASNIGLAPGATNTFNFVVPAIKPLTTTNLTANVLFSRVVLEGGQVVDATRQVTISKAAK